MGNHKPDHIHDEPHLITMKSINNTLAFFGCMLLLLVTTCFTPVHAEEPFQKEVIRAKGHLIIIGGGSLAADIQEKMITLGGGRENAKILIVPFALEKETEETTIRIRDRFLKQGCKNVDYIYAPKEKLDLPENLAKLDGVSVVYYLGGNQATLYHYLNNTKFLEKINDLYMNGAVIGGTSAGAAVMSKIMLSNQTGVPAPDDKIEPNYLPTADGFGYLKNIIIDPHFLKRKRMNRIFSTLMDHPTCRGLGIDERTALIVSPNGECEVVGESRVMIVEPMQSVKEGKTLEIFKVLLLSNGDKYQM
jgi:cyanophycinase